MDKARYQQIRAALSFRRRYLPTALFLAADLAVFLLGLWLVTLESMAAFVAAQFLFAMVFFHNFALLHEFGHECATPSGAFNNLAGHWSSLFCFLPFYPWKYIHTEHHSWAGNLDRDPTLKGLRAYREKGHVPWVVRLAWRSWVPILAFLQHFVLWSYPLMLLKVSRLRGHRLLLAVISVLVLPTTYTALYLTFPGLFNFRNFGFALLIYLVVTELINLPHHLGTDLYHDREDLHKLPLWDQFRVTRSCYYPALVGELLLLNFNFHVEHHLFPNLPWYQLRKARALVREALGADYQESVGISWNLKHRRRPVEEVVLGKPPRVAEAHTDTDAACPVTSEVGPGAVPGQGA
jgi:omega-6 fatty acid desaturase (delta-12 desaturase)